VKKIFLFFLLSACFAKKPIEGSVTQTIQESAIKNIVLPALDLRKKNPFNEWILDLTKPRLSTLSAFEWECAPNPNSFLLSLKKRNIACTALIKENKKELSNITLECTKEVSLKVNQADYRCKESQYPLAVLSKIRLPHGAGLYIQKEKDGHVFLEPNVSLNPSVQSLSIIELKKTGPYTLNWPEHTAWLSTALENGAVRLDLDLVKVSGSQEFNLEENTHQLWLFKNWILQLKAPKYLQPIISSNNANESKKNLPKNTLQEFVIKNSYSVDSLKNACQYAADWLGASQVLHSPPSLSNKQEAKKLEFECVFRNADESRPQLSLTLTQLAFPLMSQSRGIFPLKNAEETRSLAALQSLRPE